MTCLGWLGDGMVLDLRCDFWLGDGMVLDLRDDLFELVR